MSWKVKNGARVVLFAIEIWTFNLLFLDGSLQLQLLPCLSWLSINICKSSYLTWSYGRYLVTKRGFCHRIYRSIWTAVNVLVSEFRRFRPCSQSLRRTVMENSLQKPTDIILYMNFKWTPSIRRKPVDTILGKTRHVWFKKPYKRSFQAHIEMRAVPSPLHSIMAVSFHMTYGEEEALSPWAVSSDCTQIVWSNAVLMNYTIFHMLLLCSVQISLIRVLPKRHTFSHYEPKSVTFGCIWEIASSTHCATNHGFPSASTAT